MSDLEDKIFRQNVPGRWSSIDTRDDIRREEIETNNDHNNNNDNGDDDNDDGTDKLTTDQELLKHAKQMDDDGVPDPIKRRILMERENMHSTGVKGVLADYKTHLKLEQARKEAEKEERKRIIDRMVNGAKIQEVIEHNEVDETLLHLQSMLNKNIKSLPHEPETLDLSDDDDDDDDFEDDEFMTVFRQQRMQEMIAHASKQQKTSESDTSLPIYGECIEVFTSDEFLEQIDKTDSRSTLVLHVYDPSIRACITLNQHLQIIAHEWRHVKFILMNIDVSEIQIDRVALPALSIYRGGNCINVITAIAEELAGDSSFHSAATRSSGFSRGDQFTIEDIKWIFETSEGWN